MYTFELRIESNIPAALDHLLKVKKKGRERERERERYLVHPHGKWVPVCYQKPLAYVKLCVIDEQRTFDVLLYDPFPLVLDNCT